MMKGWYRDVEYEKELHYAKFERIYRTLPRTGGSFTGVIIYIKRLELPYICYEVSTSGLYLYVKQEHFPNLTDAINYAKRIMKYINYGRFRLKILDEKYFR